MSITAAAGTTVTLDATFTDVPGGSAVDPTTVSLSVLDASLATAFGPYTYAGATITRAALGFYRKNLAIPSGTTVGDYTVAWTVVIDGDTRVGYETLTVTAAVTADPTALTGVRPWYCTREDVKATSESRETARNDAIVDRACESATRAAERNLHRVFYPILATRTFDWPNNQFAAPYRLWLDANELIEITEISSGGVTIDSGDYLLRPDTGPPYSRVELDLSGPAAFGGASTHQRSISITGLWGYTNDETDAGATTASCTASDTTISVSNSAAFGVGSLLRIGDERLVVTAKRQADTGQNLQTALTAQANATTVAVTDGTDFAVGETITLDSERMLVVDITANNLLVIRGWDGSTLATHSGSDIYAPRTAVVARGALGTTAVSHNVADIAVWVPPGGARQVTIAQSLHTIRQERIAYGGTVGGTLGSSQREIGTEALDALWEQTYGQIGRKHRVRAA